MNIALTEFWISPRGLKSLVNSTILSDNLLSCYGSKIVGQGKAYYYNSKMSKYQVYCIVVDNIFYVDYACPDNLLPSIKQQMWILKHIKGVEYNLKRTCIWEQFNLPTVEQLNEFAKRRINATQE